MITRSMLLAMLLASVTANLAVACPNSCRDAMAGKTPFQLENSPYASAGTSFQVSPWAFYLNGTEIYYSEKNKKWCEAGQGGACIPLNTGVMDCIVNKKKSPPAAIGCIKYDDSSKKLIITQAEESPPGSQNFKFFDDKPVIEVSYLPRAGEGAPYGYNVNIRSRKGDTNVRGSLTRTLPSCDLQQRTDFTNRDSTKTVLLSDANDTAYVAHGCMGDATAKYSSKGADPEQKNQKSKSDTK